MTSIRVEDGLTVRFPQREAAFVEGVEIGLLLAELASGAREIVRVMSPASLPQAEELARGFGYLLVRLDSSEEDVTFRCVRRGTRPKLSVVR